MKHLCFRDFVIALNELGRAPAVTYRTEACGCPIWGICREPDWGGRDLICSISDIRHIQGSDFCLPPQTGAGIVDLELTSSITCFATFVFSFFFAFHEQYPKSNYLLLPTSAPVHSHPHDVLYFFDDLTSRSFPPSHILYLFLTFCLNANLVLTWGYYFPWSYL